jgi:hypothetical protein
MREIVHLQTGQCGNQIGAKVRKKICLINFIFLPFLFEETEKASAVSILGMDMCAI